MGIESLLCRALSLIGWTFHYFAINLKFFSILMHIESISCSLMHGFCWLKLWFNYCERMECGSTSSLIIIP